MFANRIIPSRALPVLAATLAFLFAPGAWAQAASCTAGHPNPNLLQATPTADFDTTATDGTVIHTKTGLMWKRCAEEQEWNGATCTGNAGYFNWEEALAVATSSTFAGYADWRVPNIKELQSIVESCGYSPAINQEIFPATPVDHFLSASSFGRSSALAWLFDFGNGLASALDKLGVFRVRLVRGGQSFDSFDLLLGVVTVSKTMAGAAAGSVPVGTNFPITLTCGATTLGPLNATTAAPAVFTNVPVGSCTVSEGTLPTIAGVTWDSPTYAPSETVTVTVGATTTPVTVTNTAKVTTYDITTAADPAVGGTVDCTPNPVDYNGNSTCTTSANPGYTFANWSGDCTGSGACTLNNVTSAKSVTAQFTLNSYAITATANPTAGGTVSCAPNPVDYDGSSNCSASANPGYTFANWSGDCTGSGACTLNNVTSAKSVTANFNLITFTGPTATGTGDATATVTGGGDTCGFASTPQFVAVTSVPVAPPAAYSFPHGLFDFALANCTSGGTVTLTLTYPSALPSGTVYWKYGPTTNNTNPHWYPMPATIAGNTVTLTITDGSLGDDDLTANGSIVDQGGPGVPNAAGIPTLSEWALLGLIVLLGLSGWWLRWRRSC